MNDKLIIAYQKALEDPSLREEFYRTLYQSNFYLLISADPSVYGEISGVLQNEVMPVVYVDRPDGKINIPAFSSKKLLLEVSGEKDFIKLPAKTVLELTRGAHIILNPKTKFTKEIFPGEIEAIISGEIYNNIEETKNEQEEFSKILLFSPGPNWVPGLPIEEQEDSLAHFQHFAKLNQDGNLLLGGPLFSKEYGSLMLIPPGLSSLDIEEFAEKGPLVIKGILTYAILPWQIVFGSKMKAFE
ncbi:MAG: hypothetical protein HON98_03400 [Chloroflexi bacterium]|jgi:hypothetical protein|nr:hypothetical protein [Chloroflexota bacterium]MBT3670404.1 hypothetical protein [Chloroflexota bacterium]MBT4003207.1 hypothetical protein [Chloroflexota bacterium]MBT4305591.1 hypothetical protein [Chloroflexota bacterium]MBT4533203.1 hypothetical protein [Chloroflexota bacterium]